ncbi:lysophospholipase L1-like esterase [Gracilibacillus halotolerans]|uniref:Lysophospholipase L1-like esterase n=1 Tax=Gracilibacillus halotolerans TaxID=74386 RepID=A0A841RMT8_9BACI|nr:SGNH/GDSL hydrolase family protein [Gracilibacillus halotolerans]MBB6512254.1 lysophospholipase L1-like esterase [Gracilibacillus halotolerans]
MLLEKGDKLIFIGDSVTDCDRAKPEGEGLFQALGNGYVSIVDSFLQSTYPELGVRVVNKGISGNTVRDLKARWQEDIMSQEADWVSIMIGINDVWRQFDSPNIKEHHVYIEEYEETLRSLVKETQAVAKQIVLMTPFYIEQNASDLMRAKMDEYGAIVKKISEEEGTIFIDTQDAFLEVLDDLYAAALAWDRVHPNQTGHTILAKSFLNTIGFDWTKM